MTELPMPVRRLLERGAFCHVAAVTPAGPHVTPMVFAEAGGRVWVTTSRGSVKARAWRSDHRVAGMVRAGGDAVMFTGTATMHDALDPDSWGRSLRNGPLLALAAVRFTRKNTRFFAGYAVDASRVPLAWTPPGRVFVELTIDRTALIDDASRQRTWGEWPVGAASLERFRALRTGPAPLAALPSDVREALGEEGNGVLAVEGSDGPVSLPVSWVVDGAALYSVLSAETFALAGVTTSKPPAALGIDHPSSWRARHMVGAMARGDAEIYELGALTSGERSAREIARKAGLDDPGAVLVRLRPRRYVWWRGWTSGTVEAG
ncbi:MAG: pyridoxamine 5'-phosphate oxidase family protein [Actinomycetota bacterium]|nr:pyridoxamine 5'-phosphate oxidase family protein [Actinomycetota bacterium]